MGAYQLHVEQNSAPSELDSFRIKDEHQCIRSAAISAAVTIIQPTMNLLRVYGWGGALAQEVDWVDLYSE